MTSSETPSTTGARTLRKPRATGVGDFHTRGAYFTPPRVATFLARWAIRDRADLVLEPTCGEAAFLGPVVEALRSLGADDRAIARQIHAFDLDEPTVAAARGVLAAHGIDGGNIALGDFFEVPAPGQIGGTVPPMQAVVGNPPFIRYQHFTGVQRARAQEAALRAGVPLSGLASSWAASLVHASEFLAPQGRLAMVLPAELLTVNYAEPIRRFLKTRFAQVSIVLFEELVFDSALADVVLVLAEGEGGCDHFSVHHVANEADLDWTLARPHRVANQGGPGKWTSLLLVPNDARALFRDLSGRFCALEDYGRPQLGLVTGANAFFAIRPSQVAAFGLAAEDIHRISPPGTRHLRGLDFGPEDWTALAEADERVYLLRLNGPVTDGHPAAALLAEGERTGVAGGYKCRIRDPWYVLPRVGMPDLFFTYMSHRFPRLVANGAGVGFLNSMHGIVLQSHRELARAALPLLSLNSLTLLAAEVMGRAYGGGVLKMEPREAAHLLVPAPTDLARAWNLLRPRERNLDAALRAGDWQHVVDEVDEAVLRRTLELTPAQVARVRRAGHELRERRLHRGRKSTPAPEQAAP